MRRDDIEDVKAVGAHLCGILCWFITYIYLLSHAYP